MLCLQHFVLAAAVGIGLCGSSAAATIAPALRGGFSGSAGYHAYGQMALGEPISGLLYRDGNTGFYEFPVAFLDFDLSSFNLENVASIRLDTVVTAIGSGAAGTSHNVHFVARRMRDAAPIGRTLLTSPTPQIEGGVQATYNAFWQFHHLPFLETSNLPIVGDGNSSIFADLFDAQKHIEFQIGNDSEAVGNWGTDDNPGSIRQFSRVVSIDSAQLTILFVPEPSGIALAILGAGIVFLFALPRPSGCSNRPTRLLGSG